MVVTIAVLLAVLGAGIPGAGRAAEPFRVLFISSYHPMFQSFMPQVRGLMDGLAAAGCGPERCQLDIEFMDTKRFPGAENVRSFEARLAAKLGALPPYDVFVVGDDNALAYALSQKNGLFAARPIVFLGVNDLHKAASLDDDARVSGVVEAASVLETIAVIRKLSAPAGEIFVITDDTPSAAAVMADVMGTEAARRKHGLHPLSMMDHSYTELAERLAQLPAGTAVLFVSASRDRHGRVLALAPFMNLVTARAAVPIYTLWDDNIGMGVVGGRVVDPHQQGWAAGNMVADIARGRPIREIPVLGESPNRYKFDWLALQRFAIDRGLLPPGSVVVNLPRGVWEEHKAAFISAIILFGAMAGVTAILIFYTARLRRLRNELRESERRFRDYSAVSSDYYWEIDRDLRFSFLSDVFEDVTGVPPDRLLGRTREQTGRPPGVDAETWAAHLDDLENHREFRGFVHARTKPGGETVWLEINGKPVFAKDGEFMGYRGTGRDITTQKAANERLRELMHLADQANRAKSEFLANMSHDLRTPLNSIIGFSEMIREETFGPIESGPYREYINHIHQCGKRLVNLVNDILDLARIESGEYLLVEEWLDIPAQVSQACDRCRPPPSTGDAVRLSVAAEDCDALLFADERAVGQILDNLITNAIKHGGPAVNVEVSWRAGPDGTADIRVADDGPGIPPEQVAGITEPFRQGGADSGRRAWAPRKVEGFGLGLNIVEKLSRLHGAELLIDSGPGRGAVFTVRFPAARIRLPAPAP
ncbi:MAG: hypothetical protein COW30_08825 [Rhodospirillales bacterium CG15_BIG_FIL_POST_REV_8_21_14_020_66_15]|nr:MAG: hypothetical protein COW30_08825 [Rhodospirillales bacterium CG15_BIG_FIL_POST_REV_8_21_14_020_66_15]